MFNFYTNKVLGRKNNPIIGSIVSFPKQPNRKK